MLKDKFIARFRKSFWDFRSVQNLAQNYDESLFAYLLEESEYKEEFKNRFFVLSKGNLKLKLNNFFHYFIAIFLVKFSCILSLTALSIYSLKCFIIH